jgi:multidrug efflux pump subunit AcrA (membrane-fusion protein)
MVMVPRIGRDAEESTESIAVHGLAPMQVPAEPGEEQAATTVQAPQWDDVEIDEERRENQTRFINARHETGLFDLSQRVAAYIHEVTATLTVTGRTSRHSVLDLSQKHVIVGSSGMPFSLGMPCEVVLRCGKRTASFKSIVLRKIDQPESGFGLHIASLTRAQLTDLVLLIEEASKVRSSARRLRRLAALAFVTLSAAALAVVLAIVLTKPSTVPVDLVKVGQVDVPIVLRSSAGEIVAEERTVVRSSVSTARAFKLAVKRGDRVDAGAVLARADDRDMQRALAAARGRVAAANAAYHKASDEMRPSDPGATDRMLAARARLGQAKGLLAAQESELTRVVVTAPMPGLVTEVHAMGDLVEPGAPLVEIVNDATLRARVPFAESDAPRLAPGMTVQISVPGVVEPFPGRIEEVGATVRADADGRWVMVDVALHRDPRLRAGSSATGVVTLATRRQIFTLPAEAVEVMDGAGRVVLIGDDGRAVERTVTVGPRVGDRLEILDGVDERTSVVAHPEGIATGQRLEPRKR